MLVDMFIIFEQSGNHLRQLKSYIFEHVSAEKFLEKVKDRLCRIKDEDAFLRKFKYLASATLGTWDCAVRYAQKAGTSLEFAGTKEIVTAITQVHPEFRKSYGRVTASANHPFLLLAMLTFEGWADCVLEGLTPGSPSNTPGNTQTSGGSNANSGSSAIAQNNSPMTGAQPLTFSEPLNSLHKSCQPLLRFLFDVTRRRPNGFNFFQSPIAHSSEFPLWLRTVAREQWIIPHRYCTILLTQYLNCDHIPYQFAEKDCTLVQCVSLIEETMTILAKAERNFPDSIGNPQILPLIKLTNEATTALASRAQVYQQTCRHPLASFLLQAQGSPVQIKPIRVGSDACTHTCFLYTKRNCPSMMLGGLTSYVIFS